MLAALAGVSALADEQRAAGPTPASSQSAATTSTSPATGPTTTTTHPTRLTEHVLIVSVDGLRPDMLLRCRTPYMHELFETGTYTFWARTTPNSITLPSHTSMLTGVSPRKHGIEWNRDLPLSRPVYPLYPTIFGVAKKLGYTTAMVAGKSKFETLAMPKTLDYLAIADTKTSKDTDVAGHAAKIIRDHRPQVMFVHFPGVDNAGHAKGWGTPDQVQAVEGADKAVGAVLQALNEAGLADETIVILSADHGGAGKNHGPDDARARHIPRQGHRRPSRPRGPRQPRRAPARCGARSDYGAGDGTGGGGGEQRGEVRAAALPFSIRITKACPPSPGTPGEASGIGDCPRSGRG